MALSVNPRLAWVGAAVLLGGLYYVQVSDEADRSRCQAEVNASLAANIRIRSELTTQFDKAQGDVLDGMGAVLTGPPTTDPEVYLRERQKLLDLFNNYGQKVKILEAGRAANPVPDLKEKCG